MVIVVDESTVLYILKEPQTDVDGPVAFVTVKLPPKSGEVFSKYQLRDAEGLQVFPLPPQLVLHLLWHWVGSYPLQPHELHIMEQKILFHISPCTISKANTNNIGKTFIHLNQIIINHNH
jgi:hypothetical protein